uniref:Uncharacterized protein n=1 Tax=Solanum tuberosum TaxID=4113 RepID=M1DFN9_SOLTU
MKTNKQPARFQPARTTGGTATREPAPQVAPVGDNNSNNSSSRRQQQQQQQQLQPVTTTASKWRGPPESTVTGEATSDQQSPARTASSQCCSTAFLFPVRETVTPTNSHEYEETS